MRKYALEEYVLNEFNASSKARNDVSVFVKQNGYETLGVNDKTRIRNNKIAKSFLAFKLFAKIFITLGKKDILFIQTSEMLLKPILAIKRIKRFKVVYLIHDLFSLRYNEVASRQSHAEEIKHDMDMLSQCDYVIAHNPTMISRLKENGCRANLISLDIFDYATDYPARQRKHNDKEKWVVAFAGYIPKSQFLNTLDKQSLSYNMNVYGGPSGEFKQLNYRGKVEPEQLPSVIEGHFGLIWEGSYDLSTQDNYTMLNNPHKMSMYIVAGLPIIAWNESASAKFVEKHNIGFSVASLSEIENRLKNIDSKQYDTYVANCMVLRNDLINGKHVSNALAQCE